MRLLKTESGEVLALAFSPNGEALAAAVDPAGVYLWNLEANGPPVRLDTSATDRTRALHFAPSGRSVGWLGWNCWKAYDRDDPGATEKTLDGCGPLLNLVQARDGSRVVTQHTFPDSALVGWMTGPEGWEQDWSVSTQDLSIRALAVDPAGDRVAVICQTTSPTPRWWEQREKHPVRVDLRSAVSGVIQATGPYPYELATALAFAPDGSQLVAVHGMTLVVWSVPELSEPARIRNDSRKHFTSVCYHPNGHYLFASSNDSLIHVFDTRTWARVTRFTWKLGRLRSVSVSADGTLAAAGGYDGEVIVWDMDL